MKISLLKRSVQAGIAGFFLTAGLAYGDIVIAWPALSEAAMTAGQGTPVMTWAADATIPSGLGTDGLTWGNNLSSTFQQVYYSVGSAMGNQNFTGYSSLDFYVKPGTGNSASALQIVVQSVQNGYMQPGNTMKTITGLANGWSKVSYSFSDPAFTGNPNNLAAVWSIGVGFWQPTGGFQMELGGIRAVAPIPEPSTLALLGFGVVAFGLTAIQRRKLVK
jgi:hypothetical protein